jgi:hypothetical protein
MVQNLGKFKTPKILFFLEFGQGCMKSDHSAQSILAVPTTLLQTKKSKVLAFWECWHPLSPESFTSLKNLHMLSKNFNCSDVCSFVSCFVYVRNKGSHIVGRT